MYTPPKSVTLVVLAAALGTSAIALASAAPGEITRKIPDGPPSMMTNVAIAEHNKELKTVHPDFIRCRKIEIIGSLAKKARVCRTNEQWAESWKKGNTNVRDTADAFAPKFQDCRNSGSC